MFQVGKVIEFIFYIEFIYYLFLYTRIEHKMFNIPSVLKIQYLRYCWIYIHIYVCIKINKSSRLVC